MTTTIFSKAASTWYDQISSIGVDVTEKVIQYSKYLDPCSLNIIAGGYASYVLDFKSKFSDIDIFTVGTGKIKNKNFTYSKGYCGFLLKKNEKNKMIKSSSTPIFPSTKSTDKSGYFILKTETCDKIIQYVYISSEYITLLNRLFSVISLFEQLNKINTETSEIILFILQFIFGTYVTKHFDLVHSQMFILRRKNKWYAYDASEISYLTNFEAKGLHMEITTNKMIFVWKRKHCDNFKKIEKEYEKKFVEWHNDHCHEINFISHYFSNSCKIEDVESDNIEITSKYLRFGIINFPMNSFLSNFNSKIFSKTFSEFLGTSYIQTINLAKRININIDKYDVTNRIILTLYRYVEKYDNIQLPPVKNLKNKLIYQSCPQIIDELVQFIKTN